MHYHSFRLLQNCFSRKLRESDDTCARYLGCLAMTSLLGSGRRCHFARAAAALASSLDFLQGTSEKIHLQGLLCQKLLQAMDFLAVSRCVRAGPRRFLSWFNHLQLSAPLVEAPRSYPEFSCQLTDIFASLHAFDSPLLKFPGVSLSLHCGSFPGNCALFLCVSSRVHSIVPLHPLDGTNCLSTGDVTSERAFTRGNPRPADIDSEFE